MLPLPHFWNHVNLDVHILKSSLFRARCLRSWRLLLASTIHTWTDNSQDGTIDKTYGVVLWLQVCVRCSCVCVRKCLYFRTYILSIVPDCNVWLHFLISIVSPCMYGRRQEVTGSNLTKRSKHFYDSSTSRHLRNYYSSWEAHGCDWWLMDHNHTVMNKIEQWNDLII